MKRRCWDGGRKFGVGDVDYLMQVGKKELRVLGKYGKIKKKTQWWNFNIPKIENQTFIISTIFLHFPNQFLSIAFWFVTIQFISLQAHHGKGRQTFSISLLAQCFFFLLSFAYLERSQSCVYTCEREREKRNNNLRKQKAIKSGMMMLCIVDNIEECEIIEPFRSYSARWVRRTPQGEQFHFAIPQLFLVPNST